MNQTPNFPATTELGSGCHLIESGYHHPGHTAVYLIIDSGRAALYDTGIGRSASMIIQALQHYAITPTAVDQIYVSHCHLDHSAGTGDLIKLLPNARVICHPVAAIHLSEQSKLIAGARSIYGANFDNLYGKILPVPAERIDTVTDGERISLGKRELEILYTPGHTYDHISVVDRTADCIFAGDSFGVCLSPKWGFTDLMRIPAAPTQFSPKLWQASINMQINLGLRRIFIAHYGELGGDFPMKAKQLCDEIDAFVAFARVARNNTDVEATLQKLIKTRWHRLLKAQPDDFLLEIDLLLSSQGVHRWLQKHLDSYIE